MGENSIASNLLNGLEFFQNLFKVTSTSQFIMAEHKFARQSVKIKGGRREKLILIAKFFSKN
jgi:hypothetical protein